MRLQDWDIKWSIRWGPKWTETPVVIAINGAAFEPVMAWNAKEQRIEIRPGKHIPDGHASGNEIEIPEREWLEYVK